MSDSSDDLEAIHEAVRHADGDDDPKVQAFRLRLVESDVRQIKKMVREIRDDFKSRVALLEQAEHQRRGAWRAIIVVSAFVSFVVGTAISVFRG